MKARRVISSVFHRSSSVAMGISLLRAFVPSWLIQSHERPVPQTAGSAGGASLADRGLTASVSRGRGSGVDHLRRRGAGGDGLPDVPQGGAGAVAGEEVRAGDAADGVFGADPPAAAPARAAV